jgi:diguanylate cyclase (GGDEF)-like protein/PAS domain S-box-containing protein
MKGIRHHLTSVVGVFVFIVVLQVVVAALTIGVLSSVRAYVTGESLYSKGQKDAQLHLRSWLRTHDEAEYRLFLQSLAVPEGGRRARRALQQPSPDLEEARDGFLAGQNHPDDIAGMIRLFTWGQDVPFMARAIRTWTAGDAEIAELRRLADDAHDCIAQGRPDAGAVERLTIQAPVLNARLTRLERDFSDELGTASRLAQSLLLGVNVIIGVMLSIVGATHIRATLRSEHLKDAEMRELVGAVGDGVLTVDERQRVHSFNRSAEGLFGCRGTAAMGEPLERFIAGGLPDLSAKLAQADAPVHELVGLRADGSAMHLEASLSAMHAEGRTYTIIVCRDVTERRAARELERRQFARRHSELERKALTDSLTGLPNREALEQHLDGAVSAARQGGAPFAVLFLDLDGFKKINDVHGHLAGDQLLKEVAGRLRLAVRREDEVFRVSGDEFVAIVTGEAASATARSLADRILEAIRKPCPLGDATARVTASIGVASWPENGVDARSLLLAADSSMYRAKQAGKDMACA